MSLKGQARTYFANTSSKLIGNAEPIGKTEGGENVYLVVAFPYLYLYAGHMAVLHVDSYLGNDKYESTFVGKVLHTITIGDFLQDAALVTAGKVIDRSGTILTPYWSDRASELQGCLPRLSMDTFLRFITLESGRRLG